MNLWGFIQRYSSSDDISSEMVFGILKKFDIIHGCCLKTCGHESVSAERCDYGEQN